jgi:hypothetical protein
MPSEIVFVHGNELRQHQICPDIASWDPVFVGMTGVAGRLALLLAMACLEGDA